MTGDNIKKLRENLGMTQTKFAEQIGITQSAVTFIESNKRKASKTTLMAISQKFGVRLEWLETGEGEMYTEQDTSLFARLEAENKLTPKGREFLEAFLRLPVSMQDLVVDATAVLAQMFPKKELAGLKSRPDELTKAEVYEAIGIVPSPTKPDSELSPDEAADKIRQERANVLAAQKRETITSSASTGTSGTSKKIGNSS